MIGSKFHILLQLVGGVALLVLAAFTVLSGEVPDDERAFVSADKVRAAIETATAGKEGPIGGIAVETEDEGPTLIEVIVQDASGTPFTVEVNAGTNSVEEVEKGIEEHHALEKEKSEESSM